jgi:hypothetical protein
VIKINVCLRADTNPFLAALYGRHPVRPAVRPTVDFRPTEASKAAIRYDRFTSIRESLKRLKCANSRHS